VTRISFSFIGVSALAFSTLWYLSIYNTTQNGNFRNREKWKKNEM